MSNWNEEVFETLSRLAANSEKEKKSLAASLPVSPPENDKLCASLIEQRINDNRSLVGSVRSSNNEAMEIYQSIFG